LGEVVGYKPWSVYEYFWGAAVVDRRTGKVHQIAVNGSTIDVENQRVILHDNGIEFEGEGK
jgi:hypothetical protein